jgi:hypothetical protein
VSSKRQQLVNKVKERFAAITTANGYQTNIGAQLTEWHLSPKEPAQLPGLDVRDETEETVVENKNSGVYERKLQITAIAELLETTETATQARKAEADIIRAVGVDQTWGGLARRTLPETADVTVDDKGQRIGAVRVVFQIEYSRKPWEA